MNKIKTLQGIANVYDSSEAKGFEDSENYPIAWELVFLNDSVGKEFSLNALKTFRQIPKEQGYILDFGGEHKDLARCLECVFRTKDTFRKVLNETLKDMAVYNEQTKEVIPKMTMLADAGKVLSSKMAIAV